jgi:hypothetical protein
MKKIFAIMVLALVSVAALAQSGRDIYNKYSDEAGVSSVYVSPAMFRLIGKIPDIQMEDSQVNFSSIIKSMSGFYIVNSENPDIADMLYTDVKKFIQKGDFELLMEAKEDGQVMRMYTAGDDKTVTSFVMINKEESEVSFIAFDGKMNREELEVIIAEAAAD